MLSFCIRFVLCYYLILSRSHFVLVHGAGCPVSSSTWASDCTVGSEIRVHHSRSISSGTPNKQTVVTGHRSRFMKIDPHVSGVVVKLTDLKIQSFWACGGSNCAGGAIYGKDYIKLVLIRCHFHSNQAGHTPAASKGYRGGAILLQTSRLFSLNTIFTSNNGKYGAAVHLDDNHCSAVFIGEKSEVSRNKGVGGNTNSIYSNSHWYSFANIDDQKIGSHESTGHRNKDIACMIFGGWEFLFGDNYGYQKRSCEISYARGQNFYKIILKCAAGNYRHEHYIA